MDKRLKFWNGIKEKVINNTLEETRKSFSFSKKFSQEERIDYCNKMILLIEKEIEDEKSLHIGFDKQESSI